MFPAVSRVWISTLMYGCYKLAVSMALLERFHDWQPQDVSHAGKIFAHCDSGISRHVYTGFVGRNAPLPDLFDFAQQHLANAGFSGGALRLLDLNAAYQCLPSGNAAIRLRMPEERSTINSLVGFISIPQCFNEAPPAQGDNVVVR